MLEPFVSARAHSGDVNTVGLHIFIHSSIHSVFTCVYFMDLLFVFFPYSQWFFSGHDTQNRVHNAVLLYPV